MYDEMTRQLAAGATQGLGAATQRQAPQGAMQSAMMAGAMGAMGGRPAGGENVGQAQQAMRASEAVPPGGSQGRQGLAGAPTPASGTGARPYMSIGDPRNYDVPQGTGGYLDRNRQDQLYGGHFAQQPGYVERKAPPVRVQGTELNPADWAYAGRSADSYLAEADDIKQRYALSGDWRNADLMRDQQNAAMGQMQGTRGMMQQAAQGQVPSVAEAQLQGGIDRSVQAQMAVANAARGGVGARAGALRQAQLQGADMQAGVANQAAALRAQEMATARGQLLGADNSIQQALSGIRGQDVTQATTDLQSALQNRAQNDQSMLALYGLGNQSATTEMQARQAFAGTQAQHDLSVQLANANLEAGHEAQQTELNKQLVSSGAGAAAGAAAAAIPLMFSDKRAKKSIEKADDDIDAFLSKLRAYKYEYTKDAKAKGKDLAPEGKHVSVMAQDLERLKAGKQAVDKHESGYKTVNYGKALPVMLASLGRLHARVSSLAEATKGDDP